MRVAERFGSTLNRPLYRCVNTVQELDDAVSAFAPDAFSVLADLVRADSTVGREAAAEEVLAAALERLGFAIERLPIPESIADDPLAGVPQLPYTGRYDLV